MSLCLNHAWLSCVVTWLNFVSGLGCSKSAFCSHDMARLVAECMVSADSEVKPNALFHAERGTQVLQTGLAGARKQPFGSSPTISGEAEGHQRLEALISGPSAAEELARRQTSAGFQCASEAACFRMAIPSDCAGNTT